MRIREYRPSDAAALSMIFYRSVREVASRCYTPAQIEAWAPRLVETSAQNNPANTEGRLILVAVDDADEPIAFGDLEANGHIDHLYASPDALGSGAASEIYNRLESHARELGLTRLYVEASECAVPFFERKGYVRI